MELLHIFATYTLPTPLSLCVLAWLYSTFA